MKHNKLKWQVSQTIEQKALLSTGCKVAVALSGGADSVALLLVLEELGYAVTALHCNFHLRGEESNRDERFVTGLCQGHGLTLHIKHFDTQTYAQAKGISIEMAARELRYEWFGQMLKETGIETIAVAHHKQDQAETILLNLLRGTGLRGLCGMRYCHRWESTEGDSSMLIVRPLLDASRRDIEDYLRHHQQEWVTDSTNNEREALRNRIRLDILPQLQTINSRAMENIAGLAYRMQECLEIYEKGLKAERVTTEMGTPTDGDTAFQCSSLTALHEHIRAFGFTSTQEQDIWNAKTGACVESSTHRLLKNRDHYILKAKQEAVSLPNWAENELTKEAFHAIPHTQLVAEQANTVYFDSTAIKRPLTMRFARKGDRFKPFGMRGTKLVSDFLTDKKVDRFQKECQPVLCDAQDTILWLVGHRAADTAKVTSETTNVLKITLI